MRALAPIGLAILVATGCGDETEPRGEGGSGAGPSGETLVVEVLHAGLVTAPIGAARERAGALVTALAASPADVVCLQGVWDAEVRRGMVEALRSTFPFAVDLPTADGSRVDAIPGHEVPAVPEEPPCGAIRGTAYILTSCMWSRCSVQAGGVAQMSDDDCLLDCSTELQRVLDVEEDGRCSACLLSHLAAGEDTDTLRDRCTDTPHGPLALGGDAGLVVLSRDPVEAIDLRVLPSTWRRQVLVRARVLHGQNPLEVVCASLQPADVTGLAVDPPEEARAADGGRAPGEWTTTNALHVEALLAFVEQLDPAVPAVVMGSFGNSPARVVDGRTVLAGLGSPAVDRMSGSLQLALDPVHPPACTVCADNPLVRAGAPPSWMNRVYLRGAEIQVEAVGRVHLGHTVAIEQPLDQRATSHVPITAQYGTRATLRLP